MLISPIPIANQGRWPSDVELWRLDVDLRQDTDAISRFLSPSERERMGRYKRIEDRLRFASARSGLREILGAHVRRDPAQLEFGAGAYGRPSLVAYPHVSFNVSHSGERVLIAVSMKRAVGVDIEEANQALDWRALLGIVCVKEEALKISNVRDFYQCWTAKEALLKATGAGIGSGDGLKSIDLANSRIPEGLGFAWLDDFDGYAAAIAFSVRADSNAL
ncbi:4'-phosphopantetheinyl transferase [Caballeronia sordidicola]|uniref:4'-phosphopantetheinyl transferase n=1 Tax=Caballeronia sordidicola TaxID=196367 RepID=A0A158GQD8_CABSO|nr:4'-phosphopantetheinyl transferase superfamily protein [Caballeronia sordidicola]SAL33819.1 4'-phosphopantetheinyl transferase [Caballeronia sordidicola]